MLLSPFNEGAVEYIITGRTIYSDHALLFVSQELGIQGNNYYRSIPQPTLSPNLIFPAITSSLDNGGSENWSLQAETDYNTLGTVSPTTADSDQQGVFFNTGITNQEKLIFIGMGILLIL